MPRYANATYVASRGYIQPAITARNNNCLGTSFHATKTLWAPALYKYCGTPCGNYVVKEQRDVKQWTLCIMDAASKIAPQAGQDPDVLVIPDSRLDTVLNATSVVQVNAWLALTDFGVVAVVGQTIRQVLEAILAALGHSPDAGSEL